MHTHMNMNFCSPYGYERGEAVTVGVKNSSETRVNVEKNEEADREGFKRTPEDFPP